MPGEGAHVGDHLRLTRRGDDAEALVLIQPAGGEREGGADELGSVGHWFDSDANSGWRRGRRCGWIGPGAEQEEEQRKVGPGAAWGSRQGEGGMRHALPLTEPDRDEKDRDWGRVSTFDNCLPGSDGIRHGQAIED